MKKRKLTALLTALAIVTASLAGCGAAGQTASPAPVASQSQETSAQSPAAREVSISIVGSEGDNLYTAAQAFAEAIEANTDGRYIGVVYPNNVLANGDQVKELEMVQKGTIDIVFSPLSYSSTVVNDLNACIVPWLWKDVDTIDANLNVDSEVGQYIAELVAAKGLHLLGFVEAGFREFVNAKKPVTTPDDMKGMKVRVISNMASRVYEELGCSTTNIAFGELFTAMQQGAVDACDQPVIAGIMPINLYEAAPYVTIWGYQYEAQPMLMSDNLWNDLSEDDRKAFIDAAAVGVQAGKDFGRSAEAEALQTMKDAGTEIIELTNEQKAVFKAAVEDVSNELLAEYDPKLVELLQAINQ